VISLMAGLVLVVVGMGLHSAAHDRLETVVDFPIIEVPRRYVTDGIYQLRHPAYLGNLISIAGIGIAVFGWSGMVLVVPALPFYADRILREERIRRAAEKVVRAGQAPAS
jgi:protein-S-isoprenylcysteine O-methyltransferase Ste14